jgi:threonylcarbamoyladenosine tRNA methylthiotransferase MtaB
MRVRLGSLDPSLIKPNFVEKIAKLSSLAPHFHLSMQSGCNKTLARMKRKYNTETALAGIELLRSSIRDVQFTTDIITGFPGETDEDFKTTVAFMDEVGFVDAHIFTYSRRTGTPAADMTDQVPRDIAKARTSELISRQKEIRARILAAEYGKTYSVLFETDENGYSVGHTPSFIEVRVKSERPIHSELHSVKLDDAENGIVNGTLLD